jgi:hypothetical protein
LVGGGDLQADVCSAIAFFHKFGDEFTIRQGGIVSGDQLNVSVP